MATSNISLRLSQDDNNHNPQNAISLRVRVGVEVRVRVSWNVIWHIISILAKSAISDCSFIFLFMFMSVII